MLTWHWPLLFGLGSAQTVLERALQADAGQIISLVAFEPFIHFFRTIPRMSEDIPWPAKYLSRGRLAQVALFKS